ncbi:MAG: cytidylate kinase-like family protein [Planctomycetes bacterium]|nr:cytidylate kinase-like family protein [Planctomycetota bacterium]
MFQFPPAKFLFMGAPTMSSHVEFSLSPESFVRAELHHAHHLGRDPHRGEAPRLSVAISREVGANGREIARATAERLGWSLQDRALIEQVAGELRVPVNRLEAVDERHLNWLQECALLISGSSISENVFFSHVATAIIEHGKQGNCVIVGRGATFLLPPRYTLRVRLVAPFDQRAAAVAQERHVPYRQAERYVTEADQLQRRFVKEHFHRDITDTRNYDLVLNTARWSTAKCVDLMVEALDALRSMRAADTHVDQQMHLVMH